MTEFDLRPFFTSSVRIMEDVKKRIDVICQEAIDTYLSLSKVLFPGEKMKRHHILLLTSLLAVDSITQWSDEELLCQKLYMKPMSKVLSAAINAQSAIPSKVLKYCKTRMGENVSSCAVQAMGAILTEMCGIMLQSCERMQPGLKTLTIRMFEENGVLYKTSKNEIIQYESLIRFLNLLRRPKAVSAPKSILKKSDKTVSFDS